MSLPRLTYFLAAATLLAQPAWAQEAPENASDSAAALHVLNRIAYGPKPGDVEAVEKMGIHNYIEQQLHPEKIDDSQTDAEIAKFEMLQMPAPQLGTIYYDELKERARLAKQAQAKAFAAGAPAAPAAAKGTVAPAAAPMTEAGGAEPMQATETMPGNPAAAAATAAPEAPTAAPQELRKKPGALADAVQKAAKAQTIKAVGEIEEAKLVRAVDSKRQLQEVLVDFWENHFNVDVKKGPDRILEVIEDRDVIRPHIWGNFRDLLEATAKSPAMLYYLDNASNTVERTLTPEQQAMRARYLQMNPELANLAKAAGADIAVTDKPKKTGGVNENYGREIMELHTIGVNAGYTQKDVQEVARCFTGWTFDRQTGDFVFHPYQHDNGSKVVLGHVIPAGGGIQDGETVFDILCSSPACAKFISRELCQRFVSDNPSDDLVNRIAGVFTKTNGNLRAVTEAILNSPEFLSPASYGNKIKSPLEFAVSAVRASDSTLVTRLPEPFGTLVPTIEGAAVLGKGNAADRLARQKKDSLNWHLVELGEPLFACTPPTGYGESSTKWVSPGALIERLNFALALTQQEIADVTFNAQKILGGVDLDHPEKMLDQAVAALLNNNITDGTRAVLKKSAVPASGDSQTVNPNKLIALILGSPEFQRK